MSDGQTHGERLEGARYVPDPTANNVKVRLVAGGPEVDLGVDAPTLLTEGVKALFDLAKRAPGYAMSPILAGVYQKLQAAKPPPTPPKGCRLARTPCPACRGPFISTGGRCPKCGMSSAGGEWRGER